MYTCIDLVATGETWIGKDAQAKGLCDGIGTVDDVLLDYRNKGHGLYSVKYTPKEQQRPFGSGGGGGNGSIIESIQDRVLSMFLQWIQQRLNNGGAGGSGGGLGGVTGGVGDGVWPPPMTLDHATNNNSYTNSYTNVNNSGMSPYISGLQGMPPDSNSSTIDLPIQARAMAVIPSAISDIKL